MDYEQLAKNVKKDSSTLAATANTLRNKALLSIAAALKENAALIFHANKKDLDQSQDLPAPIVARLSFDQNKLDTCVSGIKDLIHMDDPLFKTLLKKELDEDLLLTKVTCPIGVIGVIFESRPDALVQISTLCLKSGNCAILKGGSEAKHTNRVLFDIIYQAGKKEGLPDGFISLVESREGIDQLLACHDSIDLIIPRGSNEFVQYIMNNSQIPVMGHADGICHIYVDKECNMEEAYQIIVDSKTQYPAACNAVETLLLHEDIADALMDKLETSSITLNKAKDPSDYKEYLDTILTVKKVASLTDAIHHINQYGSHHTDCILTTNENAIQQFMSLVDSAGVYANCSTRFADGFRYGFGAEVGISTGKLHARGPVGLDGLVTYKYMLRGHGQTVNDYAKGKKQFHFKEL